MLDTNGVKFAEALLLATTAKKCTKKRDARAKLFSFGNRNILAFVVFVAVGVAVAVAVLVVVA